MVRAPCCEKMGLKKGAWTPEEDQLLVSYIKRFGHGNWRALPKLAGLLRCGKSCRLRWMNYLRPDIKRGNFTKEEEDSIISLHEMLGNRWSAIAARLPGRTDNEIKNLWHTYLKKRMQLNSSTAQESKLKKRRSAQTQSQGPNPNPASPIESHRSSSSSLSSLSSIGTTTSSMTEIDESLWSDALPLNEPLIDCFNTVSGDNDMSYWLNVFIESGDPVELPAI